MRVHAAHIDVLLWGLIGAVVRVVISILMRSVLPA